MRDYDIIATVCELALLLAYTRSPPRLSAQAAPVPAHDAATSCTLTAILTGHVAAHSTLSVIAPTAPVGSGHHRAHATSLTSKTTSIYISATSQTSATTT